MRASLLLGVVAALMAASGPASAQNTFGGQSGANGRVTLPSYATKGGALTSNTHWGSKITSWMPNFRTPTRSGTVTDFPNPETDGLNYLSTFGFRRMR